MILKKGYLCHLAFGFYAGKIFLVNLYNQPCGVNLFHFTKHILDKFI